jgi:hypothetical protein
MAITNNAAMKFEVLIYLQDPDFNSFGKYPEMGMLDHKVVKVLFYIF